MALSHDDSSTMDQVARVDLSNGAVEFPYDDNIAAAIGLPFGYEFNEVGIALDGSFALLAGRARRGGIVARLDLTHGPVSVFKCPRELNSIVISANGAFELLACRQGPSTWQVAQSNSF